MNLLDIANLLLSIECKEDEVNKIEVQSGQPDGSGELTATIDQPENQ